MTTIKQYVLGNQKTLCTYALVFLLGCFFAGMVSRSMDGIDTGKEQKKEQKQEDTVQTIINQTAALPVFQKMSAKEKEVFLTQELYQKFYCIFPDGLNLSQQKAQEVLK